MQPAAATLQSLNRHLRFFEVVADSLRQLEADLTAEADGWRINYAVDFSELHAYAFPDDQEPLVAPFPDEPDLGEQVRGRLALDYLFSPQFRPVYILPPHLVELHDYIRLSEAQLIHATAKLTNTFGQDVARSIRQSPNYRDLLDTAYKVRRGGELSRHEKEAIVTFAMEHFKEAYACLVSTRQAAATQSLLTLLRESTLVPLQDEVSGTDEFIETSRARGEQLGIEIHRARGRRPYPSLVDGAAYALLESINEVSAVRKVLTVLITHSEHFLTVVRTQSTAPFTRDLNYLLAYFSHLREHPATTLERVREAKPLLENVANVSSRIIAVLRRSEPQLDSPTIPAEAAVILKEAEALAPQLRKLLDCRENLDLMQGNRASDRLRDWLRESASNPRMVSDWGIQAETTISRLIVESLLGRDRDLEQLIEKHVELLANEFNATASRLQEMTASLSSVVRFGSLSPQEVSSIVTAAKIAPARDRKSHVLLGNIPGEPPISLRIDDPALRKYSMAIESVRRRSRSTLEPAVRRALLAVAATARQEARPAVHALLAYLHCCSAHWDDAVEQLDIGLRESDPKDPHRYNLLLLKCIVLRKLGNFVEGLETCARALESYPDDAPLTREMAVLSWLANKMPSALGEPSNTEHEANWARAIRFAERAHELILAELKRKKGRAAVALYTQTCNTLAYLYAERGKTGDLERADEFLDKMAQLVPKSKWMARFIDTEGFIYLTKAASISDGEQRRHLLISAIASFALALERPELTALERSQIREHYEDAEQQLRHLA